MAERLREKADSHRAENLTSLPLDSIQDYAIFMLDPKGFVSSWNMGAARLKGYRAEEIIGRHFSAFYPREDLEAGKCERGLEVAKATGRFEEEGWRVRKDGTRFWANVVISATRDQTGRLVGFAKVTRDLTERKLAEEVIRQSEERFRALVSSVQDYGIFMLDPEGRVATWNIGAERIKGYRAEEIIGEPSSRFYPEEDIRSGKYRRILETARTEGRTEDEGWRVRKDGTMFWANVVITALRGEDGMLVGFAKVTRDLTERKKAEEERLELARAQETLRLRDEFLVIASHELRTPLTSLQLQLQTLENRVGRSDPQVGTKMARAVRSGNRLARLIDTLLEVSTIASGAMVLRPETFDLGDLLRDVIDGLREPAEAVGSKVLLHASEPCVGKWDRARVEQVFTNILANALKYGMGSPVEVSLASNDEGVAVEVRDKGPGIAEQDLERIFGRYERSASSRHYGGLGVGLYVAMEVVRAHGGTLNAHNMPDGGACFVVKLPFSSPSTDA